MSKLRMAGDFVGENLTIIPKIRKLKALNLSTGCNWDVGCLRSSADMSVGT